jgi:hypothetical protein
MKSWRVVLDFFVYHAVSVDEVRALLPIILASHESHVDILPKARITELDEQQVTEHVIDDSVKLSSHLMSIDRTLVQENQTEWEIPLPSGNKFVWVKKG